MFTFRPIEANDFELLTQWRNAPHVDVWWDGVKDFESLSMHYGERLSPDHPVRMYLALRGGAPFGRIQYEPTRDWLAQFGDDVANIDFLIGSESDIGKGLGPRMISCFIQEVVLKDGRFTRVVADPAKGNRRSVRALEKAGFRPVGRHRSEGQDCLIMEWTGGPAD